MRLTNNGDQIELVAELENNRSGHVAGHVASHATPSHASGFLPFDVARRNVGLRIAALSAISLVGCVVLAGQAHQIPSSNLILLLDCYIAAFLLGLAALVTGVQAIRNLFGGVVIDEHGIRLTPLFFRLTIPWNCVENWECKNVSGLRLARINVRRRASSECLVLSGQWFNDSSLHEIERQLRRHASELERT